MTRRSLNVTDAELGVLKALWDHGPSTIRELTDLLYPDGGTAHYATVQKLLERLGDKACVRRRSQGRGYQYQAAVSRSELIAAQLRSTADKLCEGSLTPLLTQLVDSQELSSAELAHLRKLVARLEREESKPR